MPAVIAPEHFQTEQSFVALLAPELSGSFERHWVCRQVASTGPLPIGSPARRPAR